MRGLLGSKKLRHYASNASWSIASNALPGFANYVMLLFIAADRGPAEVGFLRLQLSYFVLFMIPTLTETPKLYVRQAVEGDAEAMARLTVSRLTTGLLGNALFVSVAFIFLASSDALLLAALAALSTIHSSLDGYMSINQASGEFFKNFVANAIKNIGSAIVFFLVLLATSLETAIVLYFLSLTLFNCILFYLSTRSLGVLSCITVVSLRGLLDDPDVKEARYLSFGALAPFILDQLDKVIIAHAVSLEMLGIYTLGASTGRLAYNVVKPSVYVFYREFAQRLPDQRQLWHVVWSGTLVGIVVWFTIWGIVQTGHGVTAFRQSVWIALPIFAGYGFAIGNTVYSHAITINADVKSQYVFRANFVSSGVLVVLFATATVLGGTWALYLFAFSFALRHITGLVYLLVQLSGDDRTQPNAPRLDQ
jgi:O-antigen/teichoic acid export membrane protein